MIAHMRKSFLSLAVVSLVLASPSQGQAATRLTTPEARKAARAKVAKETTQPLEIQWTTRVNTTRILVRVEWTPEPEVDSTASCYAVVRVTKRRMVTAKIVPHMGYRILCSDVFDCTVDTDGDGDGNCYFRPPHGVKRHV